MESPIASYNANLRAVTQAFQVIATLNLTSYLWPGQTPVTDGDEYDFIVVGGGTAGSVVAARLVEAGHKTMLVEAGGDPPFESAVMSSLHNYLLHSKYDWNYTTPASKCHIDNSVALFIGKMLSGSNGHNSLIYVRGNPRDYQLWAEAANDTAWSYEKVLPYFKKSENLKDEEVLQSGNRVYHGTNGPLEVSKLYNYNGYTYLDGYFDAVAETGNEVIIDYNGYSTLGYSNVFYTSTKADGPRQSTAYAYLTPLKENPNLHVLKNTLASKVIFDEFKNAVAVEVITEDNKTIALNAKKEIILSAGTLNSPKLLMLSGIGPKDHLHSVGVEVIADLPVGKNLQDQVSISLQYQMEESDSPPPPPSNPYRPDPKNMFFGFAAVNKSQSYPDYQTTNHVYSSHESSIPICSLLLGLQDDICQQFYDAAKGRNFFFTILSLLQPKSRGEVLLKSNNPKTKPTIKYLNFNSEKSDIDKMVDSIEDFTKLSDTKYFRSMNASLLYPDLPGCTDFEMGSRDYWRCYAQCMATAYSHYAGTCAMGTVVDSRLRVLEVNGLRVVDASVMPILTTGNTNAPTIMIAEKASAMIIEDHKSYQTNDFC